MSPSLTGLRLLALLALATLGASQNNQQNDFYDCLADTRAAVVLPSDPDFQAARRVANDFYATFPLAVVYASSVKEVQSIIRCCSKFAVRLIPRSGGHSVMGECLSLFASLLHLASAQPMGMATLHFAQAESHCS